MVGNSYSNLENRVGGTHMSGGGDHGAHGAHGGHDAHDPSHMSATEFLKYLKGHHREGSHEYIEDHDKRAEAVHKLHEQYHDGLREQFHKELAKPFKAIKAKNYKGLHDKLREAFVHNDKELLSTDEADEHLKELLNEILPELKYGVKGEKDRNYQTFKAYLNQLPEEKQKELYSQLYGALRSGKGLQATKSIVDVLRTHEEMTYETNVFTTFINPESPDFQSAYGKYIAKKVEEETGQEVRAGLITRNLQDTALKAAVGEYIELAEKYKPQPKKKAHGHDDHAAVHH